MPNLFETIKVCILGSVLITAIAGTWAIQNWRWESKQTTALQAQAKAIASEADKQAKAATKFEKKQEATNDTYDKIDKALNSTSTGSGTVCFDANKLRIINRALSRKAPDTSGLASAMSKSATAKHKQLE